MVCACTTYCLFNINKATLHTSFEVYRALQRTSLVNYGVCMYHLLFVQYKQSNFTHFFRSLLSFITIYFYRLSYNRTTYDQRTKVQKSEKTPYFPSVYCAISDQSYTILGLSRSLFFGSSPRFPRLFGDEPKKRLRKRLILTFCSTFIYENKLHFLLFLIYSVLSCMSRMTDMRNANRQLQSDLESAGMCLLPRLSQSRLSQLHTDKFSSTNVPVNYNYLGVFIDICFQEISTSFTWFLFCCCTTHSKLFFIRK